MHNENPNQKQRYIPSTGPVHYSLNNKSYGPNAELQYLWFCICLNMHKWHQELVISFSSPYYRLTLCILDSSVVHLNLLYVSCSPVGRHVVVHYCTDFGNAMGVLPPIAHQHHPPNIHPTKCTSSPTTCARIFLSIDTMFITDFSKLYAVSQISFSFSILVLLYSSFALFCISHSVRCIVSPMQVVQHKVPLIPAISSLWQHVYKSQNMVLQFTSSLSNF